MLGALLFPSLATAVANDDNYVGIPFYQETSKSYASVFPQDGFVTFDKNSYYVDVEMNGATYKTHLEPQAGDIWVYGTRAGRKPEEGRYAMKSNEQQNPYASDEHHGHYMTTKVHFDDKYFYNMKVAVSYDRPEIDQRIIGGFGLGPTNTSFDAGNSAGDPYCSPKAGFHATLSKLLVDEFWSKSEAFTINPAKDSSKGEILFGAMDLSRFTGKLYSIFRSCSQDQYLTKFKINGHEAEAIFDYDNPNSYLDDDIVEDLANAAGATWDSKQGLYKASSVPKDDVVLNFGDVEIRVPSQDLWVQDKSIDENAWFFTIRPNKVHIWSTGFKTIGADLLKSCYLVHDLRHGHIAIGAANRDFGEANLEEIPAEGIPKQYLA